MISGGNVGENTTLKLQILYSLSSLKSHSCVATWMLLGMSFSEVPVAAAEI